jgi:hypothetical protein
VHNQITNVRTWHPYLETAGELNHLFGLTVLQTINTGNTVTNGENTASLLNINITRGTEDTLFQDGRNLRSLGFGRSIAASSNRDCTEVETSLSIWWYCLAKVLINIGYCICSEYKTAVALIATMCMFSSTMGCSRQTCPMLKVDICRWY